jgi:hypothetical protein
MVWSKCPRFKCHAPAINDSVKQSLVVPLCPGIIRTTDAREKMSRFDDTHNTYVLRPRRRGTLRSTLHTSKKSKNVCRVSLVYDGDSRSRRLDASFETIRRLRAHWNCSHSHLQGSCCDHTEHAARPSRARRGSIDAPSRINSGGGGPSGKPRLRARQR